MGKVEEADTFDAAMTKIENALKGQINEVYPVYKLFCEMPQGRRTFGNGIQQFMNRQSSVT